MSAAAGLFLSGILSAVFLTEDNPTEKAYRATLDGYDEKHFNLTVPGDEDVLLTLEKSWYQRYGIKSKEDLDRMESVPGLIPALGDTDKNIRLKVIAIFENLPRVDPRVVQALKDTAANDMDAEVRQGAAAALRKMKFVSLAKAKPVVGGKMVLAVFDVFDPSAAFDPKLTEQLTAYLFTALAEAGRFRVVPRNQLRKQMIGEKKGSYKKCYQESCQIELGKAVAAQAILSTQIIKVGTKCMVAGNLYDLRTETTLKGASVDSGCKQEQLLEAMGRLVEKLSAL